MALIKAQIAEYEQFCKDKANGRVLTPDGLRWICASLNYNAEAIGNHFLQLLPKICPAPVERPKEVIEKEPMQIGELELTVRAYNILRRSGKKTVEELTQMTYKELSELPKLGKVGIKSIMDGLARYGLSLRSEE